MLLVSEVRTDAHNTCKQLWRTASHLLEVEMTHTQLLATVWQPHKQLRRCAYNTVI
jgi:hypothetical protein